MRKWLRMGGAGLMLAFAVTAAAQERRGEEKPFSDAEFAKKAASGGLAEVEMGKIAKERATDPDVKKFAEKMITDHGKVNEELEKIAKELKLSIPSKPDAEEQKHIDMLRDYKGTDFDKMYIKHMVEDHEKDVKEFTRAARECKDAKLKAFAEKTLPTVKDHLDMAKKINERLSRK
jgi:putative membrane protein